MDTDSRWKDGLATAGKAGLILLLLNIFFVAISMMGAFKEIGAGYGSQLINDLAHNPFVGLFMGILITSVIQSSSTTTSLVVGLVAGGAIGNSPAEAIELAIPIIMGANIGTSVTNTIVSLGHLNNPNELRRAFSSAVVHDFFNILCVAIFFPLQLATNFLGHAATAMTSVFHGAGGVKSSSPIKLLVDPQKSFLKGLMTHELAIKIVVFSAIMFAVLHAVQFLNDRSKKELKNGTALAIAALAFGSLFAVSQTYSDVIFHKSTATFILALALLFSALVGFVRTMQTLVLGKVERLFHRYVFRTAWMGMLFGFLVTAMVQSSSVTTSIAIPLAGAGIINIYQIFPYTLGANVGTTVTALLAAMAAGEAAGLTVAFAHLLFNIFGIVVVYPLRGIPIAMANWLGALAGRNRLLPVIFVVSLYLGLPFLLIVLFG
jgi:solute carrier family 34 (sodium-dependent phosphate cotransporter)